MSRPGVYIEELSAFPPSIVGVQTAVPVFIGYTEKAEVSGKPVFLEAIEIGSLVDYEAVFGAGYRPTVATTPAKSTFNLYDSMQLFYANGGGTCYVVSVKAYATASGPNAVVADELCAGIDVAGNEVGPTLVVVPDAVLLPPDHSTEPWRSQAFATVAQKMLAQATTLQDRMAILDVYAASLVTNTTGGTQGDTTPTLSDVIGAFREAVGDAGLSYGAAYFPAVVFEGRALPASGAMAGIYTANDTRIGVWNAPANVSVGSITGLTYKLVDDQQDDLNVPVDGKSVVAIRDFTGRGPVVWGARTLDGNSPDYRYIQVRRTLIYIEQSIKAALDPFVFAANDGKTWTTVVAMVSSFLQGLWSQGGLMGSTASEAFTVECGLGSTMTGQDILDGYMIVQVTLQMIRPAEFIELTFKQKMDGVA